MNEPSNLRRVAGLTGRGARERGMHQCIERERGEGEQRWPGPGKTAAAGWWATRALARLTRDVTARGMGRRSVARTRETPGQLSEGRYLQIQLPPPPSRACSALSSALIFCHPHSGTARESPLVQTLLCFPLFRAPAAATHYPARRPPCCAKRSQVGQIKTHNARS